MREVSTVKSKVSLRQGFDGIPSGFFYFKTFARSVCTTNARIKWLKQKSLA